MAENDENDNQKPEVYKIVTLGNGDVNRREFVKCVAIATGVAVVGMGTEGSAAKKPKKGVGAAINLLLLGDEGDPCNIGCQCHMVCACESVGSCDCDVVRSRCNEGSTGQREIYDQVQQLDGSVCTCNRVAVCTCDTVCTCNAMCPCVSDVCTCDTVCTCQSVCSCVGNTHYWYPC